MADLQQEMVKLIGENSMRMGLSQVTRDQDLVQQVLILVEQWLIHAENNNFQFLHHLSKKVELNQSDQAPSKAFILLTQILSLDRISSRA